MVFDKNNEINDPAKPKSIAIIKMPPVLFPAIPVTFKIIPNTSITAKLVAKNKRIRIIIKFLNKIESKHCNNGEFFTKFKVKQIIYCKSSKVLKFTNRPSRSSNWTATAPFLFINCNKRRSPSFK